MYGGKGEREKKNIKILINPYKDLIKSFIILNEIISQALFLSHKY